MLEDGANDFLALGAELLYALWNIDGRCLVVGRCLFHAARELRKIIGMSTMRTSSNAKLTTRLSYFTFDTSAISRRLPLWLLIRERLPAGERASWREAWGATARWDETARDDAWL